MEINLSFDHFVPVEYRYPVQTTIPLHALGVNGQIFTRESKYPMQGVHRIFTGVSIDIITQGAKALIMPASSEFTSQYKAVPLNFGVFGHKVPIFIDLYALDLTLVSYGDHIADLLIVRTL